MWQKVTSACLQGQVTLFKRSWVYFAALICCIFGCEIQTIIWKQKKRFCKFRFIHLHKSDIILCYKLGYIIIPSIFHNVLSNCLQLVVEYIRLYWIFLLPVSYLGNTPPRSTLHTKPYSLTHRGISELILLFRQWSIVRSLKLWSRRRIASSLINLTLVNTWIWETCDGFYSGLREILGTTG